MITYKTGSVFDAPVSPSDVLVHAVNCRGPWGAGVAKEFYKRYPKAYEEYRSQCIDSDNPLGDFGWTLHKTKNTVAWLYTSYDFGAKVDLPPDILRATHAATARMFYEMGGKVPGAPFHFHSPRINSGLFRVPWDDTAAIINSILPLYPNFTWTVWTP